MPRISCHCAGNKFTSDWTAMRSNHTPKWKWAFLFYAQRETEQILNNSFFQQLRYLSETNPNHKLFGVEKQSNYKRALKGDTGKLGRSWKSYFGASVVAFLLLPSPSWIQLSLTLSTSAIMANNKIMQRSRSLSCAEHIELSVWMNEWVRAESWRRTASPGHWHIAVVPLGLMWF